MEPLFIAINTFKVLDEIINGGGKNTTEELTDIFQHVIHPHYFPIKLRDMQSIGLLSYTGGKWRVSRIGKKVYEQEFLETIQPIVEREIEKRTKTVKKAK